MTGRGEFFQIDLYAWRKVCELGLNAGVAYLVLACGTGRDNRRSRWSIAAIEKYTLVGRRKAKLAIDALCAAGLVRRSTHSDKRRCAPTYELFLPELSDGGLDPEWIWLPNAIVTGAAGELPPLERVRSLQDVRTLALFIELYHHHALAEDGGIPWPYIAHPYNRVVSIDRDWWSVHGFVREGGMVCGAGSPVWDLWHEMGGDAADFWEAWRTLVDVGLIRCVPHLIDGHTAEAAVIMPCPSVHGHGLPEETSLGEAARLAAGAILGDRRSLSSWDECDVILPVPRRFPNAQVMGVFRLRYHPRTAGSAAWVAHGEKWAEFRDSFDALAKAADLGAPLHIAWP